MSCNKQSAITKVTKELLKNLKATGIPHKEALATARADAKSMVEAAQANMIDEFATEADEASAMPEGLVSELNASKPRVISGKTNAAVTVTEVNNGKVYVKFPKSDKEYAYDYSQVVLDQKDTKSVIGKYTNDKRISEAVAANAVVTSNTKPTVVVSREVMAANELYKENPTTVNEKRVINAETAAGYRDATGALIVDMKYPEPLVLGSKDIKDPLTFDEADEYYNDKDGSMSKSANINDAMISLDKTNRGENFDTEFSDKLTKLLDKMTTIIKTLNDNEVKMSKQQAGKEAEGSYNTWNGRIRLKLDEDGPGQGFRNKFTMGNQEVYLHELMHAATNVLFEPIKDVANNVDMVNLKHNIEMLYANAKKSSTWKTILPGYVNGSVQYTEHEVAQAKIKWDYIFNNEKGNGAREFVVSLMTNKLFAEGMQDISAGDTVKIDMNETIIEKIQRTFIEFLNYVVGFITHTNGKSVTDAGTDMIFNIMRANAKAADIAGTAHNKNTIEKMGDITQEQLDKLDKIVSKATTPVIEVFDKISEAEDLDNEAAAKEFKKLVKEIRARLDLKPTSDNIILKIVGVIINLGKLLSVLPKIRRARSLAMTNKESAAIMREQAKIIKETLRSIGIMRDGVVTDILGNFMSRPGLYTELTDFILKLTHEVDGAVQRVYEGVLRETTELFDTIKINEDTHHLSHNEALNSVVLRTDIQSLGLSIKELEELLSDSDKVEEHISNLKKGLSKEQVNDVYSLANYMVTGIGLKSNATNIASNFGRTVTKPVTADIKAIDQLASYIALSNTNADSKKELLEFINGDSYETYTNRLSTKLKAKLTSNKTLSKEEYIAQAVKGTELFMLKARGMQVESAKEMRSTPHYIIKGYVKDTYLNDTTIEWFPMRELDERVNQGYEFIRESVTVPGSTEVYGMFTIKNSRVKRTNGALGMKDDKARGFTLFDAINENEAALPPSKRHDTSYKVNKFKEALKAMKEEYARNPNDVDMSPNYDENGNIINFSASLSLADKTTYLDLESRGTQNLARSYATMGSSSTTALHNRRVVDAIYADSKEDTNAEHEYVTIAPDSLDATAFGLESSGSKGKNKYAKQWARLPKDTKVYINEVFGKGEFKVRKDVLEALFGDDDASISNSRLAETLSAKNKNKLRALERVWQDTMKIAKNNIVIKIPEVLFGNLVSNLKILYFMGVSPSKGIKLLLLAHKELNKYEADTRELGSLARLENERKLTAIEKGQVVEIKNRLAANTVTPLIDAGLYQSIVEDISTIQDNNTVANFFKDKADKMIPEPATKVVQYMFLTQKTAPYQVMLKATQRSDFYFRYAQYYDAVNSKGHSKEKAMRDAIDNYINYEAPLNKYIRYGDSIGTWFFVRYFMGIQRVIKKVATKKPGRFFGDLAGQKFLYGDSAGIEDASFFSKGLATFNPFKIFERFGEAVTPPGFELAAALVK